MEQGKRRKYDREFKVEAVKAISGLVSGRYILTSVACPSLLTIFILPCCCLIMR